MKHPERAESLLKRVAMAAEFDRGSKRTLGEIALAESSLIPPNKSLPVDLRIVVTTASGQNLQLTIVEPIKTVAIFDDFPGTSPIGGRSHLATGFYEYALREAVPGTYKLSYRCEKPQIIKLQIHRNWGRKNQTTSEEVILLPASDSRRVFFSHDFQVE